MHESVLTLSLPNPLRIPFPTSLYMEKKLPFLWTYTFQLCNFLMNLKENLVFLLNVK